MDSHINLFQRSPSKNAKSYSNSPFKSSSAFYNTMYRQTKPNIISSCGSPFQQISSISLQFYTQKISLLQRTVKSLQNLNEQIMQEAKSKELKFEQLLHKANQQITKKSNKIQFLQETLSKLNSRFCNLKYHDKNCDKYRSQAINIMHNNIHKRESSKQRQKSPTFSKTKRCITEQQKDMSILKYEDENNIQKIKQQLKRKSQKIIKLQEEYQQLFDKHIIEIQQYAKLIAEKQATISKFNDEFFNKKVKGQSNQNITKAEKKKLELTLHDNKQLKQKVVELEKLNQILQTKIKTFTNYKQQQYSMIQSMLENIYTQKQTIIMQKRQIDLLKMQRKGKKMSISSNTKFIEDAYKILQKSIQKIKQSKNMAFIKDKIKSIDIQNCEQFQSTYQNTYGSQPAYEKKPEKNSNRHIKNNSLAYKFIQLQPRKQLHCISQIQNEQSHKTVRKNEKNYSMKQNQDLTILCYSDEYQNEYFQTSGVKQINLQDMTFGFSDEKRDRQQKKYK